MTSNMAICYSEDQILKLLIVPKDSFMDSYIALRQKHSQVYSIDQYVIPQLKSILDNDKVEKQMCDDGISTTYQINDELLNKASLMTYGVH